MSMVTALWKQQPGDYFYLSTKHATGEWKDHCFRRDQLGGVDGFIRDNLDKNLYFCPHGFSGRSRRKENAVLPRLLWSDMDEVRPEKCKLRPTIAIESSPGRFVGLWLVDQVISESLNKRMSYYLGCDKSGWDLSQVLRVPHTFNYKYQSTPRIRVKWDDGPTYKVKTLERMLPEVKGGVEEDREQVKLSEHLPRIDWDGLSLKVRRELDRCHHMKDRSMRTLMIARVMLKDGYEPNEVAAVLMTKGHPVGEHVWDQQFPRRAAARAIGKALGELGGGDEDSSPMMNGYKLFANSMEGVVPEKIDWLWYPYLARGEVTILEGDPGSAKSYLMQMVGKCICDGDRMPSIRTQGRVQGKVFFADAENSVTTVTANRLAWNGIKNSGNFFQEEEPFTIDDRKRMKQMYEAIDREKPLLVVFDTVSLYIGSADTDKASQTTQALAVFKDLARRYRCAVVVIRHLTKEKKGQGSKSLYRGQGSIAFAGVARIVLICGTDPEDKNVHMLAVNKMNLGKMAPPLEYTITSEPRLNDPDRCIFEWGDSREDLDTDAILSDPKGVSEERQSVIDFIKETLADGGIAVPRIEAMAEARGIARATLYRTAKMMKVVREAQSPTGLRKDRTTTWSLPEI
jgi:AAA domain/RepB DNA-primase from phage plasmid